MELAKLIFQGITLVVTIAGWSHVSRSNDKRDQRKEARDIISDIRTLVIDIETRAFEYYKLPPGRSAEAGVLLKQQLKRLSMHATSLANQTPKVDISAALATFRTKVTGGDFESIMRPERLATDPLMGEIALAAQEFFDKVEASFQAGETGKKKSR